MRNIVSSLLLHSIAVKAISPLSIKHLGLFVLIFVELSSEHTYGTIRYDLSVTGEVTGAGFIEFQEGSFETDGTFPLSEAIVDFQLAVDPLPAQGELEATPEVSFTDVGHTTMQDLEFEVFDNKLIGLDLYTQEIFYSVDFFGDAFWISHLDSTNSAARLGETDFYFTSQSFSSSSRCDFNSEICMATLQAELVPDLSPGDLNQDGKVDGFDFLIWQRHPAGSNLTDWQANYATSQALFSGTRANDEFYPWLFSQTLAVPEPGAVILAVSAMLATLLRLPGRSRLSNC